MIDDDARATRAKSGSSAPVQAGAGDRDTGARPQDRDELLGLFRDGLVEGHRLGAAEVTNARREAAEDGYRRGQQSAAQFYSTQTHPAPVRTLALLFLAGVVLGWLLVDMIGSREVVTNGTVS